ncbi:cation transporter [Aureivirga sp. CE67]|uniref:cation transporter n=1 Tax=Aureivirga sp. CE67 TaxID=1788983 RepID=UPI0018CBE2A1|nr:heavy metal-associated domain-containing protein [Aureivirga sp. CE67]
MKLLKTLTILISVVFFQVSCSSNTAETKETPKQEAKKEVAQKATPEIKNIEVSIEGMTCQIGCAKIIQSKLSKMNGVEVAKVKFDDKKGQISYDAAQVSEKEITEKINSIAGGTTYKVTGVNEIEKVTY